MPRAPSSEAALSHPSEAAEAVKWSTQTSMQTDGSFELPLWAVFILALLVTLLSVEFGYRWADFRQKRSQKEVEAPVGAMVGATLALLAFILGFSFSIAADAFHARKEAVVKEANAIRSTYLLAKLLPEPHGTEVRKILGEYVRERLQWVGEEKVPAVRSGEVLLGQLWEHAVAVGVQNSGNVDVFLDSVNEVTQLRTERLNLRERSRIPVPYMVALLLLAILAHTAMGYHGGVAGTTRSPVMLVVAIAFSLVMLLITDIDRPGQGLVNVSQQAMIDVRDSMVESKP